MNEQEPETDSRKEWARKHIAKEEGLDVTAGIPDAEPFSEETVQRIMGKVRGEIPLNDGTFLR